MGLTASIYTWQSTRADRDRAVARLRKGGYNVRDITYRDVRLAEAYPARRKEDHRQFNPANVPGL